MSEKIMLTGGTGMLGAHLLYRLTAQGKPVRAVYRNARKIDLTKKIFSLYDEDWEKPFSNIIWVETDLEDLTRLEEVMRGMEQVYHCAAMVSFAGKDAEKLVRTNVQMTSNVLNTALDARVAKVVHVSSVAAVGRAKEGTVKDENTQWTESKRNTPYARSKYLSELECWRACEEGLDVAVVNPSIILGPGDWKKGSAALIGRVARGFKFYSSGVNGFVDARDVAEVMQRLMESDIACERFVLNAENKPYREVFNHIADGLGIARPSIELKPWFGAILWRLARLKTLLVGGKALITRATVATSFQKNYTSNKKVRERLSFEFRPVEEGLKDIAKLYQKDQGKG